MSSLLIGAALETALAAITPPIATAWENTPYKNADGTPGKPVPGTAFQQVFLLLAQPANDEFGPMYREEGFLQVNLNYPLGEGAANAVTRAELIRSTFTRGASFTASGQKVHVSKTPEIMPARTDEDRYVVPVRIPFHAHIEGA